LPVANQHQQKVKQQLMLIQAGEKMVQNKAVWYKTKVTVDLSDAVRDNRLFNDFHRTSLLELMMLLCQPNNLNLHESR
jgi:hypothetical protein